MEQLKRLLTLIISLSIVLQLFILPMNVSAARDAYVKFPATSYDSYEQDSSKITFAADRVGTIASGDWLCFKAIDFGELGPYKVDFTTAHPSGHGSAIRLRLDDPKGEVFVDVPYVTSDYSKPVTSSAVITKKVTGVHDLYVSSVDKNLNFLDVTFYERTAEGGFKYEPYKSGTAFSDLDGADCSWEVDMLHSLGIIPGREDGLYRPDVEASRGEFAYSIFRLYNKYIEDSEEEAKSFSTKFTDVDPMSKYAEAIAFVSKMGIMNGVGADRFDPHSYIKYADAIVVAMRVLGYKEVADAQGGYTTGYLKTAKRLKVGTNITTNDGYLSRSNMAILLENLLHEDCLYESSISSDNIYYSKGDGILANTQDMHYSSGVVTATAASSVNMPDSGLEEDEVLIGGVVYKTGSVSVGPLLGYECDFWYEEKDSVRILRAIAPSYSTEYFTLSTMDGDCISRITNNLVDYYTANSKKKETIDITKKTSVIYNGVAIDKTLTSLVDNENDFKGTVTYVENGDGSTVLFVDEYKDYYVEAVNPDTLVMTVMDSKDKFSLDSDENFAFVQDIYGNGKRASQLVTGDIVTIYQSKNIKGRKVTRVYLSDVSISGTVTEFQDDDICVDGKLMVKSNLYADDDTILGEYVTFLCNIYGDIVEVQLDSESPIVSGMFWEYDVAYATGFADAEVSVKLIAEDSKQYIYPLASSVIYNGRRFKDSADIVDSIPKDACRALSKLKQEEIIRYRLNGKNQIVMIDTYDPLDGGSNDTLIMWDLTGSYKWDVKAGIISMSSSPHRGVYHFPGDALVYTMFGNLRDIPDKNEARDVLCAVKAASSSILTNENITLRGDLYSLGGDEYSADVLVFERTNEGIDWSAQILVEKVYNTIDSEENSCMAFSAIGSGGKKLTYLLSEDQFAYPTDIELLSKVQPGDVLRMREHNSMVVDVQYMFLHDGAASRGSITPNVSKESNTKSAKKSRGVYGTVERKEENYIIIKTGVDDSGNDILDVIGVPMTVTTCQPNGKGGYYITGGKTLINVTEGDTVYAAIHTGDTSNLIIYGYSK